MVDTEVIRKYQNFKMLSKSGFGFKDILSERQSQGMGVENNWNLTVKDNPHKSNNSKVFRWS